MADLRLDDPQIAQRRIEYWVYGEVLLAQGQYDQAACILSELVQSATRPLYLIVSGVRVAQLQARRPCQSVGTRPGLSAITVLHKNRTRKPG